MSGHDTATGTPSARRRSSRRGNARRSALAVLAPALWFAHLLAIYALVPWSCRIDSVVPLHAVTVLGVAGTVGCVLFGLRELRRDDHDRAATGDEGRRPTNVTTIVLLLAAYFAMAAVLTGIVPLVVDPCA